MSQQAQAQSQLDPSMVSQAIGFKRKTAILLVLCGIYTAALLWGIRLDLPIAPEADESIYVIRSAQMAITGSLDPGWYGNPGSTTFYPLAAIYYMWGFLGRQSGVFGVNSNLMARFEKSPTEFYLMGRLLTIAYGVLSALLVYKVGELAFENELVGIWGAGLSLLYPIFLFSFQFVRTDSSGLFFGLLALWFCLLIYEKPTKGRQILSGSAIGLALSTRYFMIALIPVYLAANLLPFFERRGSHFGMKAVLSNLLIGLFVTAVAFVFVNPFLFINFSTTLTNLEQESRTTQLGWDGLSPIGNLLWYFTTAIPKNLTWPQMILTVIGVVYALRKRQGKPILILIFVAVFLGGISLSTLHWERWIIQILPLFSLFAVLGLGVLATYLQAQSTRPDLSASGSEQLLPKALIGISSERKKLIFIAGMIVVAVWPTINAAMEVLSKSGPSTRILARAWVITHLPHDSRIVTDKYAAPLQGTPFHVYEQSWAPPDRSFEQYVLEEYDYFVMNGTFYGYFLAEPERYSEQLIFYTELFEKGERVMEIYPSWVNRGAAVYIFKLPTP